MKNTKFEPKIIKSADPMEEGQRILASIIARDYLRKFRPECHTESLFDSKTKDNEVQK